MSEVPAQPKRMEAPDTNRPRGHLHQFKSSKKMQELEQVQITDWEDEASEDKAKEEEELARVQ
jgi:hypothetical protein